MTNEITDAQVDALEMKYVSVKTEAIEWLKKHYPVICIKSGLCEKIGGKLYTKSCLRKAEAKPELAADERERFECWLLSIGISKPIPEEFRNGEYANSRLQDRFEAWQAAKADAAEQIAIITGERDAAKIALLNAMEMMGVGCDFETKTNREPPDSGDLNRDVPELCRQISDENMKLKNAAEQIAKLQEGINVTRASYAEYPSQCPITGCDFFMYIDHPELGYVPTYGGPFDSYTIPEMEGEASDPFHERELFVRRFDHDRGHWVDNESIPLRVINKNVIFDLEEKAEQTQAQVEKYENTLEIERNNSRNIALQLEQAKKVIKEAGDETQAQVERAVRMAVAHCGLAVANRAVSDEIFVRTACDVIDASVTDILRELAEPVLTSVVKESLTTDDCWIEWHGEECPVDVSVEIRFRDGTQYIQDDPHNECWEFSDVVPGSDIVAYRIVQPEQLAGQSVAQQKLTDWKIVAKDGNPPEGLYIVIYDDCGNLPVSIIEYGAYEYYTDENVLDADEENCVRGFGWHEEGVGMSGDGYTYIRKVIAYLPTNYDMKSLEHVRTMLSTQQPQAIGEPA